MKFSFISLLLLFFLWLQTFAQSRDFLPATADSIFYSGGQHFKYKGLDYESTRALKKVLAIDQNSGLYESIRNYSRTKRWMTVLEIVGLGSIGATVDDFWVTESEVRPVPLLVGLASIGTSLLLWKKSKSQLRNFVDDYNNMVYDKYIQERFMTSKTIPTNHINIGFTIRF
jgi:hypothetical protein